MIEVVQLFRIVLFSVANLCACECICWMKKDIFMAVFIMNSLRTYGPKACYLKAALFKSLVNKVRVLPIFRLSIFSVDLFLIAQLFAQPVKLSELKVCLPNS